MSTILSSDGHLKVFVIVNNIIYRKIITPEQYHKDEYGNIILPVNHFCKGCFPINGYIENLINITWEDCPLFSTIHY